MPSRNEREESTSETGAREAKQPELLLWSVKLLPWALGSGQIGGWIQPGEHHKEI